MSEQYGYAGTILNVDLSSNNITRMPTSDYSDRFLGGRGIAAKLYWDKVSPEVKAFDPGNRLMMFTGPLAGFPGLGSSRWEICGKSAAMTPQHFSFCNLGGRWGVQLKFAGYDGLVIDGRADKPVYVFIADDTVEIRDAAHLWGQGAIEVRNNLKEELGKAFSVLATGPAGENGVIYASLLSDDNSSGSGGFGAVMGAKNLKAVVVKGGQRHALKAADPDGLKKITNEIKRMIKVDEPWRPWLSKKMSGTEVKRKPCWGCIKGCQRGTYTAKDGKSGKFMCASSMFYRWAARGNYEKPGFDEMFHANYLCDEYGLDTEVVEAIIKWLAKCFHGGILSEADTGLPFSAMGSKEFAEALIQKISKREGFGDLLAQGFDKAADSIGKGADKFFEGQISKAGERLTYEPRLYITTGLLYAMESRRPIHLIHEIAEPLGQWLLCKVLKTGYYSTEVMRAVGKRFLGSELVFDFSTYEGKALATKMIQDREFAKESLILCDMVWPIGEIEDSDDHVGDSALESKVVSAVTGMKVDEEGLYRIGERIFNLQRAILVREGHNGRESDCLPEYFYTVPLESVMENPKCIVPGKDGEVFSRKGEVIDKKKFEEMKDEYYTLRGWDVATGLQTRSQMEALELQDVASDLATRGMLKEK